MSNLPEKEKQKYREALEDMFNGIGGFAIIYDISKKSSMNIMIDINMETLAQIVVDIVYSIHKDKNKVNLVIAQEEFRNYIDKFINEKSN